MPFTLEQPEIWIYALYRPITQTIIYVGQTNNLERRWKDWERELGTIILLPLEKVPCAKKNMTEARWIKECVQAGHTLMNDYHTRPVKPRKSRNPRKRPTSKYYSQLTSHREKANTIQQWYAQGIGISEIGRRTGLSAQRVSHMLGNAVGKKRAKIFKKSMI